MLCQAQAAPSTPPPSFPVTITIDAAKPTGDLNPIWRWCGYDEPNYTYAPNGKKLIAQFTGEKNSPFGPASFRTHNLLVTGDGTPHLKWGSTNAYTEDDQGRPIYDWTIVDKIFDTYHRRRGKAVRPNRFHAQGPVAQSRTLRTPLEAGRSLQQHLHRLDHAAEGLQQMA